VGVSIAASNVTYICVGVDQSASVEEQYKLGSYKIHMHTNHAISQIFLRKTHISEVKSQNS
jgi:hypothetical protein